MLNTNDLIRDEVERDATDTASLAAALDAEDADEDSGLQIDDDQFGCSGPAADPARD